MVNLKGRDFLTLQDFTHEELRFLLDTALELKRARKRGSFEPVLRGKTLAMIFQKPSTRTRVSFEVAMGDLGGRALYLRWDDLQLGRGETVADTARVLSRYVDGIMARVFSHKDLGELAKYADIPVINGLSDLTHPCQILADLLTILEKKAVLKGLKLAFVGDGNNVCNSLLIGCTKMGMNISVATPKKYRPKEEIIQWAMENAQESGSKVEILESPEEAVKDADVIYTDVFVSMGEEKVAKEKLQAFQGYQVNKELVKHAKKDYIFMHCLPAHRGQEVTDEVIDDPIHSVVWDQAENRLHAQKAVLALLL
ncbi:MAG: ornithine carbamoyltransferase [Candidatus Baldrarchaeia archaeon]